MQANEANDRRVDSKATLSEKCTLQYLLQTGAVKHPKDLTKQDMLLILDEVLGFEMQTLSNQPLAVSVYLFPYIYDMEIAAGNPLLLALCESIITFGGYVCDVIRAGCSVKDDDLNYSQLTFPSTRSTMRYDVETHDEVVDLLLKEEKALDLKKGSCALMKAPRLR